MFKSTYIFYNTLFLCALLTKNSHNTDCCDSKIADDYDAGDIWNSFILDCCCLHRYNVVLMHLKVWYALRASTGLLSAAFVKHLSLDYNL